MKLPFKYRPANRRGSSLVFLGFSVVTFIIAYGISFLVAAAVLGSFFSSLNTVPITDPSWLSMYNRTQATIQFLVPLIPSIGILILVIKVLMTASVRGSD